MSVNEKMTAIADNIREKTGGKKSLTLDQMANGVNEVYEAGKKTEYDVFWDTFQTYGERIGYKHAFYFYCTTVDYNIPVWTDETFKPKYDLKPNGDAENMFYGCAFTDFKGILEKQGVVLDMSHTYAFRYAFHNCKKLTRLPVIDVSHIVNTNGIQYLFSTCGALKYIEKLILPSKVEVDFTNVFSNCISLEEIRIEGVIAKSILFSAPKNPSIESMKSIISCLKNYAGTTNEYKYTITFRATVLETLESSGETPPSGSTWAEHIDNLKWNLTLS